MKVYKLLFTFCFAICFNVLFSQNELILDNSNIQIGIDYKSEKYLVFNGFEDYYFRNFSDSKWNKKSYKSNALPKSANFPFKYFHIKGKNYLVSNGCGEVYEFRNDSIIRIDNSFDHKNQFFSSSFVYNDELYFFGGYGLFTHKNIITKFDFKTKEWELIKYKDYKNVPEPRQKPLHFLDKDKLYIISGYTDNNDSDQVTGGSKLLDDIWVFDLKNRIWNKIGEINDKNILIGLYDTSDTYQLNNNFYYDYNNVYRFNFESNTVSYSKQRNKYFTSRFEQINIKSKDIIYGIKSSNESNNQIKIVIEPFEKYITPFEKSESLVINYNFWIGIGIISFLLCLLTIYIIKVRYNKKEISNKVLFANDKFWFKNSQIINFNEEEEDFLKFLFSNMNKPLQMNELVDYFDRNENIPYNTLTKKKDLVLNSLKQKIASLLMVREEELFVIKKNREDKRIKEISLNPQYFKIDN